MENRLVSTSELLGLQQPLPEGIELVAIKFVSLGPNAIVEAERSGAKICEMAANQPSFFIISQSREAFRAILHTYVDRFCDRIESKS